MLFVRHIGSAGRTVSADHVYPHVRGLRTFRIRWTRKLFPGSGSVAEDGRRTPQRARPPLRLPNAADKNRRAQPGCPAREPDRDYNGDQQATGDNHADGCHCRPSSHGAHHVRPGLGEIPTETVMVTSLQSDAKRPCTVPWCACPSFQTANECGSSWAGPASPGFAASSSVGSRHESDGAGLQRWVSDLRQGVLGVPRRAGDARVWIDAGAGTLNELLHHWDLWERTRSGSVISTRIIGPICRSRCTGWR